MTNPGTMTRQQKIDDVKPTVAALLAKSAGWKEGDNTFIYPLTTTIPGSHGYRQFYAHLTINKKDLRAQLDKCTDPFTLTPSQLLAEALVWVPFHITIAIWDKDSDIRNPRRYGADPWTTEVYDTDTSPAAQAARTICLATPTSALGVALNDAYVEAVDVTLGKAKKSEGKTQD